MILIALWCVSALIGSVFGALGLMEAFRDWLAIRPVHNGRRRLALAAIGKMLILFLIATLWLFIGLTYLGADVEPRISIVTVILILTNMGVSALVVLDYYERRKTVAERLRHNEENK